MTIDIIEWAIAAACITAFFACALIRPRKKTPRLCTCPVCIWPPDEHETRGDFARWETEPAVEPDRERS